MASDYKFSFGPWNISEGGDPFGPPVRPPMAWAQKLPLFKRLGFDAVMFHDDDIVPRIAEKSWPQIEREAREMNKALENEGLVTEVTAPRLWEDARTIDGSYTSNDPKERQWAIDRAKRCIDMVAFDVKAMRTQRADVATRHLSNSRKMFLHLVEKVRTFDANLERQCIANRDYEALEMAILAHLMGVGK